MEGVGHTWPLNMVCGSGCGICGMSLRVGIHSVTSLRPVLG